VTVSLRVTASSGPRLPAGPWLPVGAAAERREGASCHRKVVAQCGGASNLHLLYATVHPNRLAAWLILAWLEFFLNYDRSTADSFKEEKKAGQYNVDIT
jgi:hypothetical protein